MTTLEVFKRFQALYKETSSRFFNSDWAIELINDSVDDIETEFAPLTPEYYGTKVGYLGSPSTNGGYKFETQEYELPTDFRKVIQVLVKDRGGPPYPRLLEISYWQKDRYLSPDSLGVNWLTGGGKGESYFFYVMRKQTETGVASMNSTIGFVPIPTRNGSANGVEIVYHTSRTSVGAIDGSTYPNLPDELHPLIPYKMAMNAAAVDESVRYGYYQSQYQGRLARLLGEGLRGQGEGQEQIEVVDID